MENLTPSRLVRLSTAFLTTSLVACGDPTYDDAPDYVFAAIENDSAVAVLDARTGELVRTIDLSIGTGEARREFDIHNVQGASDGLTVWATAMPLGMAGHAGMAEEPEELIGIDVATLEVRTRIPLGNELHAAHVVVRGSRAWVTANEADAVLEVDLERGIVLRTLGLPSGTGPHGARLTPDGTRLLVAGLRDGSLQEVTLATGIVNRYELATAPGDRAVQTAVLPDASAAFVSLYDARQVARLDLVTGAVTRFDLPSGAAGPVQLYPSPDSRALWVADQGLLDGDAAGRFLFRIDAISGALLGTAEVGSGPHGVVVSGDGQRVFATTLGVGSVVIVDAASGNVVATTPVGDGPNGITCVHSGGAMP